MLGGSFQGRIGLNRVKVIEGVREGVPREEGRHFAREA